VKIYHLSKAVLDVLLPDASINTQDAALVLLWQMGQASS
jgi:hypothetical protein